jgi:hypothetical protein
MPLQRQICLKKADVTRKIAQKSEGTQFKIGFTYAGFWRLRTEHFNGFLVFYLTDLTLMRQLNTCD